MTFKDYNLKPFINEALKELSFYKPTEIQSAVIPLAIKGESIIGKSQTGTGKTHSFLIPILEKLDGEKKEVQAVILTPTRELAYQLYQNTILMTKHTDIDIRLYSGGTDRSSEIERLQSSQPQIVIGTLGKVLDLAITTNVLKIHTATTVVIDEADMFFSDDELTEIDKIFASFMDEIQVLAFSATIPQQLITFLNKYIHKFEFIDISKKEIFKGNITHYFIPTRNKNKDHLLIELLNSFEPFVVLIFANTKEMVDHLSFEMAKNNFKVAKLTGDLDSRQRKQILKRINDLEYRYIVASDIASRGIDIPGVSHVINYELPNDIEFYIHRTGRTARYDRDGQAISFYDYLDNDYIDKLEKRGLKCQYVELKNNELKETKERNARQKRRKTMSTFEQEIHRKTPMPKKVKPGYRKKRKEKIEKEIRQEKRRRVSEMYRKKARKK